MTDTVTGCAKTPLSDLLRRIPQEAVYSWTNPEEGRKLWQLGSESAPIGRLAHEAADALDAMLAASPQGEGSSAEAPMGAVAWLLTHPDEGVHTELAFMGREPITAADREAGWTAEALVRTHPPQPDALPGDLLEKVAQIIEAAIERHNPGNSLRHTIDDADAILSLIQSEGKSK